MMERAKSGKSSFSGKMIISPVRILEIFFNGANKDKFFLEIFAKKNIPKVIVKEEKKTTCLPVKNAIASGYTIRISPDRIEKTRKIELSVKAK